MIRRTSMQRWNCADSECVCGEMGCQTWRVWWDGVVILAAASTDDSSVHTTLCGLALRQPSYSPSSVFAPHFTPLAWRKMWCEYGRLAALSTLCWYTLAVTWYIVPYHCSSPYDNLSANSAFNSSKHPVQAANTHLQACDSQVKTGHSVRSPDRFP